jgi:hypothetical protein
MHSKVSSDWLPSYIKATRPVLEIFKMAGYFPDSPRTFHAGFDEVNEMYLRYFSFLGCGHGTVNWWN